MFNFLKDLLKRPGEKTLEEYLIEAAAGSNRTIGRLTDEVRVFSATLEFQPLSIYHELDQIIKEHYTDRDRQVLTYGELLGLAYVRKIVAEES